MKDTADPPKSLSSIEKGSYYAYRFNDGWSDECKYIATRLNKETPTKYPWTSDRIMMTTGAVAGLFITMSVLINKGDEVISFEPLWFNYPGMTQVNGGTYKPLHIYNDENVLNNQEIIKKLERSITNKTKLIVLNTPHNPTGTMFNETELELIADILERKSKQYGQRIMVIVDEAYRDFVYDDNKYFSLAQYYPYSLIIYTYGKILLAPQQRLGFIAISPLMKQKVFKQIMYHIEQYIIVSGWQFPNVIPGKSLIQFEQLIDKMKVNGLLKRYQAKRDMIIDTLLNKCSNGYTVTKSKGTFYLLFKPPTRYGIDGGSYCRQLIQEENVKLLPGFTIGLTAWIRVTYTADLEKIKELCRRFVSFDKYLRKTQLKGRQSKL